MILDGEKTQMLRKTKSAPHPRPNHATCSKTLAQSANWSLPYSKLMLTHI